MHSDDLKPCQTETGLTTRSHARKRIAPHTLCGTHPPTHTHTPGIPAFPDVCYIHNLLSGRTCNLHTKPGVHTGHDANPHTTRTKYTPIFIPPLHYTETRPFPAQSYPSAHRLQLHSPAKRGTRGGTYVSSLADWLPRTQEQCYANAAYRASELERADAPRYIQPVHITGPAKRPFRRLCRNCSCLSHRPSRPRLYSADMHTIGRMRMHIWNFRPARGEWVWVGTMTVCVCCVRLVFSRPISTSACRWHHL